MSQIFRGETGRSVPADLDRVRPRTARRAVAPGDVAQAPLDLGGRVGEPVAPDGGHLGARVRLRDAVRLAAGVVRVPAPAALLLPQLVQARELVGAPAALGGHGL